MSGLITGIIHSRQIHQQARLLYWQIRVWLLEHIAGTLVKIYFWKHGMQQKDHFRIAEFIRIQGTYKGQVIQIECPLCKTRQVVDRVPYELGKAGLMHGYTCGGDGCPSHTYMETVKS
jgi:hypothetical protein